MRPEDQTASGDEWQDAPSSPEAAAALEEGLASPRECPEGIYLGSFEQYADDE